MVLKVYSLVKLKNNKIAHPQDFEKYFSQPQFCELKPLTLININQNFKTAKIIGFSVCNEIGRDYSFPFLLKNFEQKLEDHINIINCPQREERDHYPRHKIYKGPSTHWKIWKFLFWHFKSCPQEPLLGCTFLEATISN